MIEPITPEKIHFEIANKIQSGATYLDALILYAEDNGLEIETLGEIIKKSVILKEKIREEANEMNLLKRSNNDSKLFK